MNITVIKIGGAGIGQPEVMIGLVQAARRAQAEGGCVIVHGGGSAINDMLTRLGIQPAFSANGQRFTDAQTLEVVQFVLCGLVNKQLVTALRGAGLEAAGLSGIDGGLIEAEQFSPELGAVGRVRAVRPAVIEALLAKGFLPVVAPVSAGGGGHFNVNADQAAGAIAGALKARQAAFVTDVPGVKVGGQVAPVLSVADIERLRTDGTIYGGMIPKTEAGLYALAAGAQSVLITDITGLEAGRGTALVP